ncbi:MAG: phosphatidylserine decarboxylase family protein [Draconibacterium sp.]|nr:MAG: phosphatidylserine decarboxylase family protein [Draconibacterium sp.]
MKLHKEGKKIIPIILLIILALDALLYYLLSDYIYIFLFFCLLSLIFIVLTVRFFRVPNRKVEKDAHHVLAPADGKIVEISEVEENEYFKDKRLKVSIFMSIYNVHQNRVPVSGEIVYKNHINGAFYPAITNKSSDLNERCATVFKTENNVEVMARQIAGVVARRIATYVQVGDTVQQGDEYGFIRFGSRVDLFLPLTASVKVNLTDKTVGGKTIIATI